MKHKEVSDIDLRDAPKETADLVGAVVAKIEVPSDSEIVVHFQDGRTLRCTSPFESADEIMFLLRGGT